MNKMNYIKYLFLFLLASHISAASQVQDRSSINLEKIATQRWIALFTNGYEAWSVVRDTGYPTELSAGVTDGDIFVLGDTNGVYPQRHRYGSGPYNTNGAQVEQANSVQGPDKQATKLWWAK
jgi:hypothetical protein